MTRLILFYNASHPRACTRINFHSTQDLDSRFILRLVVNPRYNLKFFKILVQIKS